MKPGDHLIETKLADELDVRRGTLREALRPLQNEGLLVNDGRGHLLVRKLSADEIREVFQVRAALEILAATILTEREDRDAIAELRVAIEPLLKDDLEFGRQIQVDLGFHELLCRLTGNGTLVNMWRQLIGRIEMMIIAAGPAMGSSRMRNQDHVGIASAIASGDAGSVRAELSRHMNELATKYLRDYDAANASVS